MYLSSGRLRLGQKQDPRAVADHTMGKAAKKKSGMPLISEKRLRKLSRDTVKAYAGKFKNNLTKPQLKKVLTDYLAFIIQNLLGPVLDELYREEEDEEEDEEAGDQEAGDQEAGDQGAGNQEAGDQEADLLSEDEGPENPDSE